MHDDLTPTAPPAQLLIVDDDPLLRTMAARTLRHAGFQVSDAGDGEQALEQFARQPADLVLLDVMMPGLDGFEVCHRLRAMPHGAAVPVLMLTGLNDTDSIDRAYRQGATDFITKPINWALLSHRVRYALRASAAAETMRHSREALARAQRLAGMGSWALDSAGRLLCSPELARLYGLDEAGLAGFCSQGMLQAVLEEDRAVLAQARQRLVQQGTPYQLEFRLRAADGQLRTVYEQAVPVVSDQGRPLGSEAITHDISQRVRDRERIRQLAHFDSVTGLPNRQHLAELAQPQLDRARRLGSRCAVLHVDIDRFKGVNDAFGTSGGDRVLRAVAEQLRHWVRGSDLAGSHAQAEQGVLARVGGNAFTLVITDLAGQDAAAAVAQRLLKVVALPITLGAQSVELSACIGIALYPGDATDLPGLTRCAEQAAYAAKAAGRGLHRFFDEQMNTLASQRLQLETELRRGIAGGELRLHFQPKVELPGGRIVGAEALVRWQHPQRGLVPPAEFIALAEDTGLILPLTDWVLSSACAHLRAWADAGLPPLPLAVNLAASSFASPALGPQLDALMQRHGLRPGCLTLEVTETMLMHDVEATIARLHLLQAQGCGLSLDDFGTGYSSLSYLKRFPIDELKVDRSFITDAPRGGRDSALAKAIIALGLELGLRVVAEGVETVEQSDFLLGQGCTIQQGFLFSRPVPAERFEQLLRAGRLLPLPVAVPG